MIYCAAISFLLSVIITSCGLAPHAAFAPYEGKQQEWRVADGGIVNRDYKLPIYYDAPNKPYVVLGTVSDVNYGEALGRLVDAAALAGGDALVLTKSTSLYGGSYADPNSGLIIPLYKQASAATVIKFSSLSN